MGGVRVVGARSSPKTRRWRVVWNVGADNIGESEVVAGCNGPPLAVLGDHVGLVLGGEVATTLGDLHVFTLGDAGARRWVGCRDRGASMHHDSKIS
jgi:hypothetical protein